MRKRLFITLLCACMCFGSGCGETDSNKTTETTITETTTAAETTTQEVTIESKFYNFPTKEEIEEQHVNFVYDEVSRNPDKYSDYTYKINFEIYEKCVCDFYDDIDYYYKAYDKDGHEIWILDYRGVCKDADNFHVLEGDRITAYGSFVGYMDTTDSETGINSEILTFGMMYCDIMENIDTIDISKDDIILSACDNYDYEKMTRNPDNYYDDYYVHKFKVLQRCKFDSDGTKLEWYYKAVDENYNLVFIFDFRAYTEVDGYENVLEDDMITMYGKCAGNTDTLKDDAGVGTEILTFYMYYCDIE